jgi:hypothetical protein
MNKLISFLNNVFLLVGLLSLIVAIVDKIVGFVYFGLFPLSYLRFTEACLLFVIAISVYQMAAQKQKKK